MDKPYLGPRERPLPPGQYRPCPFCGGGRLKMAIHNYEGEPIKEMVWCTLCDALGPRYSPDKELAITAWNDRHPPGEGKLRPGENFAADLLAFDPEASAEKEQGLDLITIYACPFCGTNETYYAQIVEIHEWIVGCEICKGTGPRGSDKRESTKRWNKRVEPREMDPAELSKLRKSLMKYDRDPEEENAWEAVGQLDVMSAVFADARDYEGLCDMALATGRFDNPSHKKYLAPFVQALLTKLKKDGKTPGDISELCRGAKHLADQAARDYEEGGEEDPPETDQDQAESLSACPFCGGSENAVEVLSPHHHGGLHTIRCATCRAQGPWKSGNPKLAMDLWKQRDITGRVNRCTLVESNGMFVPVEKVDGAPNLLQLQVCPFCGGDELIPVSKLYGQPDHSIIDCATCHSAGPPGIGQDETIRLWNQRAEVRGS